MDLYVIVLRLFHIVAGVFWVGSAFFNALLLEPSVTDAGQEGAKTMGAIVRRGLTPILTSAAGVTILAGILLYANVSEGFQLSWITSPGGLILTLGALCAIGGGVIGSQTGRTADKMMAVGAEIAKSGGKPTSEQGSQVAMLKLRLHNFGRINAVLLLITVMCMAVGPELLP
jgi:uncharacterized membrane protein